MGKAVKACSCVTCGGLAMGGGGYAAKKYLLDEEPIETVEQALKSMKLTLAKEKSDFDTISNNLKTRGATSWIQEVMGSYGVTNVNAGTNSTSIMNKCKQELSRSFSEFEGRLKTNEFKAIKLFCTTDYSLTENAKDYLEEGNYVYSQDQKLDEDKWNSRLQKFKGKSGNSNKGFEEMKAKCLEIGRTLYITYLQSISGEFYEYCVIESAKSR